VLSLSGLGHYLACWLRCCPAAMGAASLFMCICCAAEPMSHANQVMPALRRTSSLQARGGVAGKPCCFD